MTKYFYLLGLAMLTYTVGSAQIKKGEVLLGGSIQYTNSDQLYLPDFDKEKWTTVGPSVGWAIKDNLEIGGRLLYSFAKLDQYTQSQSYHFITNSKSYGVGIYVRQYKDLGHRFALFLEANLGGYGGTTKIADARITGLYADQKSWGAGASLNAGILYRVAHRWMFEAGFSSLVSASFSHTRDNGQEVILNGSPGETNSFGMATNLSQALKNFSFGCRYLL